MDRRNAIKYIGLGLSAAATGNLSLPGFSRDNSGKHNTSDFKITKIRYYDAPDYHKPLFNQARGIVEVYTDRGIIGIGEGGARDTIEQCAGMLIGEDPFRIEHLWQYLYRGMFYPPGREKLHALGAIEMALWDIKGKVLDVPVYDLLGGATREYVECYATGFSPSDAETEEQRARDCIDAGFRAYRIGPAGGSRTGPTGGSGNGFDFYENANKTIEHCRRIAEAMGGEGNWAIDLHTRFDLTEAIHICEAIEDLEPYFVEDIVRSENTEVYQQVRQMTTVPVAVGEQFGDRWDINELIEDHLLDYSRVTLPNTGGISELKKIAAICETHYVGMIPHFTGPLSTAALVHVLGSSSPARCMVELAGGVAENPDYFNDDMIRFKDGKLWLNSSPGLGVEFDAEHATFVTEIAERTEYPHPYLQSPDGAIHNW
ncbi:mandelate racemase/muconate lactonizing enzyme family protein [Aliifodinibius sp. S!AR15-10]|uniref:mandelate racemase/muconate lactonizing enzyme family protein n=1 Tax=Aliifodinibius sp. S!AR15-10 TaxID=2950437 RepID=UPI00285BA640|nr:mandelate racemase/muconate lactonizing enzyme family protein [Aliifodinibius sp. S!AR15-10]MDR8394429.1 mandelate racemase/muconate lactonizing enzyme family protein [Aliifodinibius sp. S!AR15-10]